MDSFFKIINSIEPLYLSIVFIIIIVLNVFLYRSLLSCVKTYPSSFTDYENEEKNFKIYTVAALAGIITALRLLYTYYMKYDGNNFTNILFIILLLLYMTIAVIVHNKIKANIRVHDAEKIVKERQEFKRVGIKND